MTREYIRKSLNTYPRVFFDIAEAASRGVMLPVLAQATKPIALSNQRLWHKFRSALIANAHPHAEAAQDLICSIANVGAIGREGRYYLEFTPRGLVSMARELKGLAPLPDEAPLQGLDDLLGEPRKPTELPPEAAVRAAIALGADEARIEAENKAIFEAAKQRPAEDKAEAFFEDLLKQPAEVEPRLADIPPLCEHEANEYGICRKCGSPLGGE